MKKIKIDRVKFFAIVRKHFGPLKQKQVDGMSAILDEWDKNKALIDLRWLAYMLATAWHETATTMQPIEEYGKGKGYKYGSRLKRSGVAYAKPEKVYYGRGHVQLTWYENYELMGRLLKLPLLAQPELCLTMEVSIKIMFEGMTRGASSFGDFTGRCLEQYFNDADCNPVGARKIINGTDKADLIAEHFTKFWKAVSALEQ
jgi:putative chitinase